jgi:hypothetical protein
MAGRKNGGGRCVQHGIYSRNGIGASQEPLTMLMLWDTKRQRTWWQQGVIRQIRGFAQSPPQWVHGMAWHGHGWPRLLSMGIISIRLAIVWIRESLPGSIIPLALLTFQRKVISMRDAYLYSAIPCFRAVVMARVFSHDTYIATSCSSCC